MPNCVSIKSEIQQFNWPERVILHVDTKGHTACVVSFGRRLNNIADCRFRLAYVNNRVRYRSLARNGWRYYRREIRVKTFGGYLYEKLLHRFVTTTNRVAIYIGTSELLHPHPGLFISASEQQFGPVLDVSTGGRS